MPKAPKRHGKPAIRQGLPDAGCFNSRVYPYLYVSTSTPVAEFLGGVAEFLGLPVAEFLTRVAEFLGSDSPIHQHRPRRPDQIIQSPHGAADGLAYPPRTGWSDIEPLHRYTVVLRQFTHTFVDSVGVVNIAANPRLRSLPIVGAVQAEHGGSSRSWG
jgi:hypothetical protein